jgi:OFA family oxalate/formate antiporter-like MFS transporter
MILSVGVAKIFYIFGVIFFSPCYCDGTVLQESAQGLVACRRYRAKQKKALQLRILFTFAEAAKAPQWWMLWGMLFLNISAGIGLISQLSPLAQGILIKTVADPGGIGCSRRNHSGDLLHLQWGWPVFWAWVSDGIGRKNVFMTLFITQAILYFLLPGISNVFLFTVIACHLLACIALVRSSQSHHASRNSAKVENHDHIQH